MYRYAYRPEVLIVMDAGRYELHVDGVDDSIAVALLDVVVESQIVSEFDGWDGDTIFELANGQIWQQSGPGIETHVAVRPDVVIFRKSVGFEMSVEGVDSPVQVRHLQ